MISFPRKILNELNFLLRTQVSDPRVKLLSVTHVDLNNDYSVASVYWDTFNASNRGDCKEAIEKMSGNLRTKLAKTIKVRHVPVLNFIYNSQYEDELKITQLLNESETES